MANEVRLGGYHGGGTINGGNVLITSGNVTNTLSPAYSEMVSVPRTGMRGPVIMADGVESYSVSMTFEPMSGFSLGTLIGRGKEQEFAMSDGYNGASGSGYVQSLSVSAQSSGLVSVSVSLMCLEKIKFGKEITQDVADETPMGYCVTGKNSSSIGSWTFEMSQTVTPVYANKDEMKPHYIRIGHVQYTLSVNSYTQLQEETNPDSSTDLNIGVSDITLKGSFTGVGYSFGGINALGTYSYEFKTGSNDGTSSLEVLT